MPNILMESFIHKRSRWNLCSTDTPIMEPCRVRNMSDTRHVYF